MTNQTSKDPHSLFTTGLTSYKITKSSDYHRLDCNTIYPDKNTPLHSFALAYGHDLLMLEKNLKTSLNPNSCCVCYAC